MKEDQKADRHDGCKAERVRESLSQLKTDYLDTCVPHSTFQCQQ